MKIQHLIPILFLAAFSLVSVNCVFGQIRGRDEFASIHAYQAEMSLACAVTMTNILEEIAKVAPEYPSLSDVTSTTIEVWGSTNAPTYYVLYRKNAHLVPIADPTNTAVIVSKPTQGGFWIDQDTSSSWDPGPQTADKLEVDNGGVELEIVLRDMDNALAAKADGIPIRLLTVNGRHKFSLAYHVSLNMPDPRLEQIIGGIINTNVFLLRSSLWTILGVNPEKGKSDLLAPVMTNILGKLKEIGPQYPLLTNLNSATIENKGTSYLYQHLRFWVNASAPSEANNSTNQQAAFYERPIVEMGGMGLDVYLLNRDEPFGFDPNGYPLLVENGQPKVVLGYRFSFNRRDENYNTPDGQVRAATRRAVDKIIEDQEQQLRKKLDNIISF